jgi:hypothetical protein
MIRLPYIGLIKIKAAFAGYELPLAARAVAREMGKSKAGDDARAIDLDWCRYVSRPPAPVGH